MHDYLTDGAEIYRRSFATIRAEADLSALAADAETVAVRMIHAAGQTDLDRDIRISAGAVAAYEGLTAGEPVQDALAAHLPRVAEAVDSGAAAALLDRWIALSQEIAGA